MSEKLKKYSLTEVKDTFIGKEGTPKRDAYEFELRLDLIGGAIRQVRRERNLTQDQLGELIGVKKAQISKIENSVKNTSIGTLMRVFAALNAKINLTIDLLEEEGVQNPEEFWNYNIS